MIVLCAGMPRAGSGWHYNLVDGLVQAAGAADAREIRRRYRLQSILTQVNCNIGVLSGRRLAMVMVPSLLGSTFTLKVHSGLTSPARLLIDLGAIRPTYIYRDPRDALLSAYEYGRRGREAGKKNAFSHLESLDDAIDFIVEYVGYWDAWRRHPQVHALRYEDLKTEYDMEAARLMAFLGVEPHDMDVQMVIERYRPEAARRGDRGVHFVHGVSGRFREHLSKAQQERCLELFGRELEKMGYEQPAGE